jgi:hypothetical protein
MSAERDLLNKALAVLLELKDCSDSWCEYYVPIGIHYRIDEAIQELLAQPEQTEKEPFKPDWVNYRQGVEDAKRDPMTQREAYQRGYAQAEHDLKREPLGLEIMDVCGSEDYRKGFKDGALYSEKHHGIGGNNDN